MGTKLESFIREQQSDSATSINRYDYFVKAHEDYQAFNESSWRKGMGYTMPTGNFPIFDKNMEGLESGLFLVAGESNSGKALALDTPILKADGQWSTIGDIKVGDYVWGDEGAPTLVFAKSEVFKDHNCYEITCDDGTIIKADANHLWRVYRYCAHKPNNREQVMSTEQMAADYISYDKGGLYPHYWYRIPMQSAIKYPEQTNLPIPPYVLGVWLANGHKCDNRISVHVDDYENEAERIRSYGISVSGFKQDNRSLGGTYHLGDKVGHKNTFKEALKQLNLLCNKHIPEQYLHASIKQRWELLQGLMDADGTVNDGTCKFTQRQDSKIVCHFGELLSSLGIKWSTSQKKIILGNKIFYAQQFFFVVSKTNSCFQKDRKRQLLRDSLQDRSFLYKTIKSIKRIGTIPTQCIQVLNNSHCYLVGSNLTVTHNTALLQELILQYASNPDNKLVGLYFSLDDTNDKIIPRLLASHAQLLGSQEPGVPISLFSKPARYLERLKEIDPESDEAYILYSYLYDDISAGGILNPELLNDDPDLFTTSVRHRAYTWLHETEKHFHLVDGISVHNGEQLVQFCHDFKTYVQRTKGDLDYNIIVGIDSFSDIKWEKQRFNSDKELNDYTSSRMKALAVEELQCPVFGTIHLRKIDQKKRPTIADVKESGRWAYEASLVFLIHNDVSRNGEAAGIFGTTDDSDFKLPVLEILWAKNKQSSFKGRTYCYFKTNFSRVWECSKEAMDRYNSLLYSL